MSSWPALSAASAGGGASGAALLWGALRYLGDAATSQRPLVLAPAAEQLFGEPVCSCLPPDLEQGPGRWIAVGFALGVLAGPLLDLVFLVRRAWRRFVVEANLSIDAAALQGQGQRGQRPYNLAGPLRG